MKGKGISEIFVPYLNVKVTIITGLHVSIYSFSKVLTVRLWNMWIKGIEPFVPTAFERCE